VRLDFGTSDENFRTGLDGAPFPVLLVRYEDLKVQPEAELRRIVKFFGHTPDAGKIDDAVRNSSFEAMCAPEASETAAGAAGACLSAMPRRPGAASSS